MGLWGAIGGLLQCQGICKYHQLSHDGSQCELGVSAELDEIIGLADRIAVLFEGKIVAVLDAAEADREKIGLLMAGVGLS